MYVWMCSFIYFVMSRGGGGISSIHYFGRLLFMYLGLFSRLFMLCVLLYAVRYVCLSLFR